MTYLSVFQSVNGAYAHIRHILYKILSLDSHLSPESAVSLHAQFKELER